MESRFSSVLLVDSSVSRRFPRFDLKIRADLTQFTNTSVAHIKKPLALAFLTHLAIVRNISTGLFRIAIVISMPTSCTSLAAWIATSARLTPVLRTKTLAMRTNTIGRALYVRRNEPKAQHRRVQTQFRNHFVKRFQTLMLADLSVGGHAYKLGGRMGVEVCAWREPLQGDQTPELGT